MTDALQRRSAKLLVGYKIRSRDSLVRNFFLRKLFTVDTRLKSYCVVKVEGGKLGKEYVTR